MSLRSELSSTIDFLSEADNGVILLPEKPSFDMVAAATSLFLSLKKSKKNFNIVCSSSMTVNFSRLVGVDKISSKMGGKSLVVSFDYKQESIERVDYNIADNRFNLIIKPKSGEFPLSKDDVKFFYSGEISFLVVIGAHSLPDLGSIYQEEKEIFNQGKILNISIFPDGVDFGQVNALFPDQSSLSEIIAFVLKEGNHPVDQDIGKNLWLGIKAKTDDFSSPSASPEAFEAAAFCIRLGARKQEVVSVPEEKAAPKPPSKKQETGFAPMPAEESATRPPDTESKKSITQEKGDNEEEKADWLGPKIYRGSRRV